jgi:hypothetical protein
LCFFLHLHGAHRQQPILRNNPTTTSRSVTKDDNNQTQTAGAIYCRVSSSKQKDDLERQIEAMCKEFPLHKVYKDIGSGLNYRRKGLSRLLEHVQARMVKEVVVAHRDRRSNAEPVNEKLGGSKKFVCKSLSCGASGDRDIHAARNILLRFLQD